MADLVCVFDLFGLGACCAGHLLWWLCLRWVSVVVCWLVLCCWFAGSGYVWCFVLLCLEMIVVFLDGCVCFVTWLSAGCDLYDCSFKCCCVLIVL